MRFGTWYTAAIVGALMTQMQHIDTGEEPVGAVVGTAQRELMRDHLRDAVEGIDVEALQGSGAPPVAAPERPTAWTATRAMAPLRPGAGRYDPVALQMRVELEAAVAPLRGELNVLRAELAQLKELLSAPQRRRGLRGRRLP